MNLYHTSYYSCEFDENKINLLFRITLGNVFIKSFDRDIFLNNKLTRPRLCWQRKKLKHAYVYTLFTIFYFISMVHLPTRICFSLSFSVCGSWISPFLCPTLQLNLNSGTYIYLLLQLRADVFILSLLKVVYTRPSSPHSVHIYSTIICIRHVLIKAEIITSGGVVRTSHTLARPRSLLPRRVVGKIKTSRENSCWWNIREEHLDNFGDCTSKNLNSLAKFGFI